MQSNLFDFCSYVIIFIESRENMVDLDEKKLFKAVLVFLVYFFYVNIFTSLMGNTISTILIGDILFLCLIVYLYKDSIIKSYNKLKKQKFSKTIIKAVGYAFALLVVYMVAGMILMEIFPELENFDGNTTAIYSIYSIDTIYTIFKTLIFATIAEELLFKETIREIIKQNVLYIIISSIIYAFVNVMYNDLSLLVTWLNVIPYLLFAILLNIIYVKNNNNICLVFLIKFFYTLIPLAVLLSGVGA